MSAMTGSVGGSRSATVSDSADLSCEREPNLRALNETLPSIAMQPRRDEPRTTH